MDTTELDKILEAEMPPKGWITIGRKRRGGFYVRARFGAEFDATVSFATTPFEALMALLAEWQEFKGDTKKNERGGAESSKASQRRSRNGKTHSEAG